MKDTNKKLRNELSILVNHIKEYTCNKQNNLKTQEKIKRLQKNQELLLQKINRLSKII
jgi:hypothetical protein